LIFSGIARSGRYFTFGQANAKQEEDSMKKKKKTEQSQKKKDFVHSPFTSLKGFATENTQTPEEEKVLPKPDKEVIEEDESELFLRSVSDVKRLKPGPSVEKKKKEDSPPVKKISEEDSRLFLDSLNKMDITFEDEIPVVEPLRPVAVNRMRQLKSGAIRINLELDLHGMSRDEALDSMKNFITGAFNRGQKAVLVITGKGNNSPGEPVLQAAVVSWLRDAGKKMVAEFAPAPLQMGGSGALVVFLKDKNKAA
jgi:DNA-nicking Smr family endonuclease